MVSTYICGAVVGKLSIDWINLVIMFPRSSQHCKLFLAWSSIKNVIGDWTKWPPGIRKLFWMKEHTYSQCRQLAAFACVNHLDKSLLELWFLLRDTKKISRKEILGWLIEFNKNPGKYVISSYSVHKDQTIRINGSVIGPSVCQLTRNDWNKFSQKNFKFHIID